MHVNLQGEDRKKSGRKRGGSRGYPELLDAGELEEMFRYPELYHNGLPEEQVEKVTDSIRYFKNNQKGLLLYQKQGIDLPESSKGLEYRSMGIMENHIWSIIDKRMKHNHTVGSVHLAKIPARKGSGRLNEISGN